MSEQVFSVTGLVPQHFVDVWLAREGGKLGRFDQKAGYHQRHDVAESAFTERALAYIETLLYATLVPPLEARTFIPTSVKANPGAESYIYRRITRTGIARLITGSSMDLPRAAMYQEEVTQRFYAVGVKIVYNYFELLAVGMALANGAPVDIVGESLRAAMEAIEKKLDYIAAFGTAASPSPNFTVDVEADVGLTGLLNNSNATAYTIPPGASGGTQWSTKTPDEVLADLNGIVGSQVATTFKVHRPDTIIVPILQFEQQLQRRMSDVSGETILSFFLRTRREAGHAIDVVSWMYAAGASGGQDVMAAYKRDPRMFEHVLAMDATPLAPTTMGMVTEQPVVAKTAGVVMRYPLSTSIGAGI